jgi:hypothetical protein
VKLSLKEFRYIVRRAEGIYFTSYPSVAKQELEKAINYSEATNDVMTKLLSLCLELPEYIKLTPRKVSSSPADPDKLWEYVGAVTSPYISGYYREAKREFYKLPYSVQVLLSLVFTGRFLFVSKSFILDNISTVYSLPILLSTVIELKESPHNLNLLFGSRAQTRRSSRIDYPFVLLSTNRKKIAKFRVGYLLRSGEEVRSNIKSTTLRQHLIELGYNFGVIILYKRVKNTMDYIVYPLVKGPLHIVESLTKGREIDSFDELEFGFSIPKHKRIRLAKLDSYSIDSESSLKEHLKAIKHSFVLSNDGLYKIELEEKDTFFKVTDYILTEDFEVIGLKYLQDGEELEAYLNVPDRAVEEGIDSAYIKIREYSFNGIVVHKAAVAVTFGMYKECPVCGTITSNHIKGLCARHYRELNLIAKSHTDDSFSISMPTKRNYQTHLYIYDIAIRDNEVVFTKNLEGFKGQLVLPFKYY